MPAATQDAPELSVIVPVCNVERYVGQCLASLSAQTLERMEVLLVDDGSTDGSPQLLAEAAAADGRMRVITKENGGYGSAVNAGLAQARGRYIGIVEPDDFVDKRMFAELLAAAHRADGSWADIVKSSYWNYYDIEGEAPYIEAPNLMNCMPSASFQAPVSQQFEVLFHHPSVWSAIYRRAFLEEHGITMMEVPGGGWVDNPFLFETMLQAESYVWEPAAYYYYRQTNPASSSNLKDYHLPFDRLRDLRALYERLSVDDPQLVACLYTRHFFYTASVIGEWGYSEREPELAALISEAMGALDADVLYGGYRGIRKEYLSFYESIVRSPAHAVAKHGASARPRMSFIVPSCNDRDVLVDTLRDLAGQSLEDIEVICVDCASADASPTIAAAFAQRDKRFTCASVDVRDYAAGMEEGLARATAPAVAVVLPGTSVPPQHAEWAVSARERGADVAIAPRAGAWCFGLLADDEDEGTFDPQRLGAELVLIAAEGLSACAFSRELLQRANVHAHDGDEDGLVLIVQAIHAAGVVALRQGSALAMRHVRRTFSQLDSRSDVQLCEAHLAVLDAAYEAARGIGAPALRSLRCLAVRRMLDDMRRFSCTPHARQCFELLQQAFAQRYGLAEAPLAELCNQNAYQTLERAMSATYERALQREASSLRGTNNALRQRAASVKGSKSYRLGNALVLAARKVLPASVYRRLKG